MILSHKYRFIFIKTTKTAGTSMEIALSRCCGEQDIVTPIDLESEATFRAPHGNFPRNFSRPLVPATPFHRLVARLRTGKWPAVKFYNHISAAEIKTLVPAEVWKSYFKFCFVRNPWDRVISNYYWRLSKDSRLSLSRFLETSDLAFNQSRYMIGDQVAVDFVGKYETLMQDFATVCQKLRLPIDGSLPRAKASFRTTNTDYAQLLSREQTEIVGQACQREIELFDYRCEYQFGA